MWCLYAFALISSLEKRTCDTGAQAMPQITDEALVALDNVFEQARYSREELGSQHQAAAQQALERMGQEIATLTKVPAR